MTSSTPDQSHGTLVPGSPAPCADRSRFAVLVDGFFFGFAGLAAFWVTWLVVRDSVHLGWLGIVCFVVAWGGLAYLALPRLHRVLTAIYVPDYFIGRARTGDGLLGDPVNLALLGSEAQVRAAMEAAGWTTADPVSLRSSWKIVTATLLRRSYDSAPVSPLFLFGRQQDLAFQQQVDGNPSQRHHVRFWRCPPRWPLPGGRRVDWLGAGTYDRSVGLSLFTLQVTHKVAADTDVERDHVVQTLVAADDVDVELVRDFSTAFHARNGGGDEITTDGDLPVVDLRRVTVHPEGAAAAPDRASSTVPRPAATTLGALLVLLGVLADLVWLVALTRSWDEVVRAFGADGSDGLTAGESRTVLVVVVGLLLVVAVAQVLLAWGVFRGREWPRMLVMVLAATSTLSSFVGWAVSGETITVHTTLYTVALDVLVLLALSGVAARTYARDTARSRRGVGHERGRRRPAAGPSLRQVP